MAFDGTIGFTGCLRLFPVLFSSHSCVVIQMIQCEFTDH